MERESVDGSPTLKMRRVVLRRTLTRPLLYGASFALLVEEWLWTWTTRGLARLARFAVVARAERWIRGCSPPVALALLVLPFVALVPCKVFAFVLMYEGRGALGLTILVVDKLLVTALFARLWQLTEPSITRIDAVRRGRDGFLRLRRMLHAWLERQPAYVEARAIIRRYLAGFRRGRTVARRMQRRRDGRGASRPTRPAGPRPARVEISRGR
jgi:hypothetical protein